MALKFTTQPLSHHEQRLYLFLEGSDINVFTLRELRGADLPYTYNHLRVLLHRLERKGWVTSVGKGTYLRLPAGSAINGKVYLEDPFSVALKLYKGYLAFQSALRVHGLTEHQPFTIFVATRDKSGTRNLIDQYEVRAVKLGERFTGFKETGKYVVSTVPKTFFDCFLHSEYAGGFPEVLKALHSRREMDWEEFISYFKRFASNSLCQRVGYLLSLLEETDIKIPRGTMDYLKSRVSSKTRLDHKLGGGGKLNKEWLVVDNIGKEGLLSWWLHG